MQPGEAFGSNADDDELDAADTRIVRPMTDGSAPNSARQNPSLKTTTAPSPAMRDVVGPEAAAELRLDAEHA